MYTAVVGLGFGDEGIIDDFYEYNGVEQGSRCQVVLRL